MPTNKTFHYKRGQTEIEANADDANAWRLASKDTTMHWIVSLITVLTTSGVIKLIVELMRR
jgi:hypothetical protein